MNFEDLRERVKGGKLDPLSKMGKSKLTGQEIATYYRKNPKAKQAARDPMVKKAIELALDLGGNQTLAVKEIEKMKKGLSKNSAVASALRTANEEMTGTSSVAMPDGIPLGKVKKRKDLEEAVLGHDFGTNPFSKKEAEEAKKLAKQYSVKVIKPKNPKSKNHLQFQGGVRNLQAFYRNLQMIMNESVKLSRPAKGQRTLTIDFSKAPNPKKAKDKTMSIAKKHNITTGKPKKPQSKDDVAFTGSKQAMKLFGKEFNLAGKTGLLENKEKLSPAKKQYYDFNIMRTKLYRFVKAKTKAHKFGIDDLMLMTSPKVIEGMYKQNPRGFTRMLDKMYPNNKEKMTKMDFTVLDDFVDARGKVQKGQGDKVDESTSLNEETILYRVKDIQKPELDKFKSSARLMKLKINIKQSPNKKETIIRLEGGKKQIRDFDAVARGKSSYGDPSLAMKEDAVSRAKETADLKDKHTSEKEQLKAKHEREKEQEKDEIDATKDTAESVLAQLDALEEQIDLLEKQFAIKPDMDWTATFSPKYRGKMRKTKTSYGVDKEDVVAMIRKKKDGKHKIKDGNTSLIVRSLARIMNQDRKGARDKGAEFGKGEPKDEMDAPKIKKMIDIVSKGITVTKKGDKIIRNAPEINAFTNVDTAIRDDVYKVINMASDGTLASLVYNESFNLNEESATMKKVRDVIKRKSMMNIDGMKLDLTTASMIASVYDKVNPTNKKRMDSLKLPQLVNLTMKVAGKARKESTELQEGQTYKSIIQGLEKDKKEVASKSKAFRQNDTKYIDKAINFLKMLEKEGIPAGQISQVDFVTNRVPKFFVGPANKSPSLSKFTPNDVQKAVAHAKKLGIIKESTELQEMHPKSMDAMKRLNMKGSDAFKDQMPTIGWDAGKQMYRVVMLSKKTGKPVRTSHIPVSREFPAPKDKNKINAKELGKAMKTLEKKIGMKIGVDESRDLPFSESILERMSGIQNKSTDFIKVPKLNSKQQSYMKKIKKRFPKLPEPVNYEIMRLTHKGNQVDSQKYVEIGNLYDKDYVGGTGGKFIQKLRNMGARLPQGHMGEAVSPAQQAAIAISKKERGEKPKDKTDECADEKDFKPHMMYDPKTGKGVMANKYADHVALGKKGYTHEKPKSEALDAKDKPFVKDLISKLRGGSKTHAKQADDLEKAMNTENRAKRDAMKDMGKDDDKEDDGYGTATDDDRKVADKNVIMQIRRVADLPKGGQIELPNGKKVKMDRKSAIALNKKFNSIRKPQDKLKLQNMMNDKKISVVALKRLLGK